MLSWQAVGLTEGLPATAANRFHKELRFFFSLLKRKKEAKKEKRSRFPCTVRQCITRRLHKRLSPTKLPRRGEQAAAAAVTLPFLQLKLGRKVSGDPPLAALLFRFLHTLRTGVCVFAQLSDIWCCDDALPAFDVQFAGRQCFPQVFHRERS